ncbi:MAG: hypothetical protein QOC55_2238, partial [Thermoleophilaceae bacterium]|nr:hypothetical protein [Thermoleophilaceae bacterium]
LPVNLVIVNALSRSFAAGCTDRVDLRGDVLADEGEHTSGLEPKQAMAAELRRGDAILLNAASMSAVATEPGLQPQTVLATNGELTLIRVGP